MFEEITIVADMDYEVRAVDGGLHRQLGKWPCIAAGRCFTILLPVPRLLAAAARIAHRDQCQLIALADGGRTGHRDRLAIRNAGDPWRGRGQPAVAEKNIGARVDVGTAVDFGVQHYGH